MRSTSFLILDEVKRVAHLFIDVEQMGFNPVLA